MGSLCRRHGERCRFGRGGRNVANLGRKFFQPCRKLSRRTRFRDLGGNEKGFRRTDRAGLRRKKEDSGIQKIHGKPCSLTAVCDGSNMRRKTMSDFVCDGTALKPAINNDDFNAAAEKILSDLTEAERARAVSIYKMYTEVQGVGGPATILNDLRDAVGQTIYERGNPRAPYTDEDIKLIANLQTGEITLSIGEKWWTSDGAKGRTE